MRPDTMQLGIHLIERAALPELEKKGLSGNLAAEARLGVLDLVRTIEGHLPEPPAGRPLVVVGLDALLEAVGKDAAGVLSALRRSLHQGRSYFEWSKIPLVVLVEGELDGSPGSGPELVKGKRGEQRWSLVPLLGKRLEPVGDFSSMRGWWWSPQID